MVQFFVFDPAFPNPALHFEAGNVEMLCDVELRDVVFSDVLFYLRKEKAFLAGRTDFILIVFYKVAMAFFA